MNAVFDQCVIFLNWLAELAGLTYVEVNVWIFCIIWPLLTLGLAAIILLETYFLLKYRKKLKIVTIPAEKYTNTSLNNHRKNK